MARGGAHSLGPVALRALLALSIAATAVVGQVAGPEPPPLLAGKAWADGRWTDYLTIQHTALPALVAAAPHTDPLLRAAVATVAADLPAPPAAWRQAAERVLHDRAAVVDLFIALLRAGPDGVTAQRAAIEQALPRVVSWPSLATILRSVPEPAATKLGCADLALTMDMLGLVLGGGDMVGTPRVLAAVDAAAPALRDKLFGLCLTQQPEPAFAATAKRGLCSGLAAQIADRRVQSDIAWTTLMALAAEPVQRAELGQFLTMRGRADLTARLVSGLGNDLQGRRYAELRPAVMALQAGGRQAEALDTLRRAEQELPYPDRRLVRLDLYRQLAGGAGQVPMPPPWVPQPPNQPLPPSPFNTERGQRLAAMAAQPGDPDLRLAVADLSGAFFTGSEAYRVYRDVARATTAAAPLRAAAWLAWAEAKPAEAWADAPAMQPLLLALPDQQGLTALTVVGVAAAVGPLRGPVLDRLLPLWREQTAREASLRVMLARLAAADGRAEAVAGLLAPLAGNPAAMLEQVLTCDQVASEALCPSGFLAGHVAAAARATLGRPAWDLAMAQATACLPKARPDDLGRIWDVVLSRTPAADDEAAKAARVALRGALTERAKGLDKREVQALLGQLDAPLRRGPKELLAPEIEAVQAALARD